MATKRKRSAAAVTPRKLAESEVTFTVELEPEDIDYREHFEDPETVAWITERLEQGHQEAWFCLAVYATWNGHKGAAFLGGCSYDFGHYAGGDKVKQGTDAIVSEYDLKADALRDLNESVEHAFKQLQPLLKR